MKSIVKPGSQPSSGKGASIKTGKEGLAVVRQADLAAIDGLEKKIGGHVGAGSGANSLGEGKSRNGLNPGGSVSENESFNRHYNKELKVSEDEIPIVLLELNESALAFITRDQFEKALLLLQKAHGVLDVVDISNCKRDQMIAIEIFYNMALCYQKLGQLEECALCLETCLDHIDAEGLSLKDKSIAMRLVKIKLETKVRMQLCAILSQLHRHKEALDQAYESAKLCNVITADQISICDFLAKKVSFESMKNLLLANQNTSQAQNNNNQEESGAINIDNFSSYSDDPAIANGKGEIERGNDSNGMEDEQVDSLSQFQTYLGFVNNLEESISLAEKSAKKLLPIFQELLNRAVQFSATAQAQILQSIDIYGPKDHDFLEEKLDIGQADITVDNSRSRERLSLDKKRSGSQQAKQKKPVLSSLISKMVDMRHILGFLNQSEWVNSLNIGNIMQITPIQREDLTMHRRNEQEVSRDAFLETVSFYIVAYFCISTEIRFILQLGKEEKEKIPQGFDPEFKTKESEYWHAKSLEIACSFLPSDCPLFNHVLLSYQKHHAPSSVSIPEHQQQEEQLEVLKPLTGIENSKFQPIVRRVQNINIQLSPTISELKPAQATVDKLLKQINPARLSKESGSAFFNYEHLLSRHNGQIDPNAQQSMHTKSPMSVITSQREKIKKIMKFEQIITTFTKEIGMDRKSLFTMLLGQTSPKEKQSISRLDDSASSKNDSGRKDQSLIKRESHSLNTGVAAQLAYNNMVPVMDPEPNSNQNSSQLMKIRTQGLKSRNSNHSGGNFSMTENQNKDQSFTHGLSGPQSQSFIQSSFDPVQRSSQGGGLLKNYDSESSIFADMRGAGHTSLNESSFNEQILDKNKLIYHQQRNVSGSNVLEKGKRTSSHEKIHRPRSSKGNRDLLSAGNANNLFGQNSQNQQKFILNKQEERSHKSQQQTRSLTGKQRQPALDSETLQKMLIQQQHLQLTQMQQQQQNSLAINQATLSHSKKSRNSTITGGDSQSQSASQLSQMNTANSEGKKNRINYDDLKRYLMKEQNQKVNQTVGPQGGKFQIKQEDLAMLMISKKVKQASSKQQKIFNSMLMAQQQQTPQQQILIAGPQIPPPPQQNIYMRPTSVGNSGVSGILHQKKREKNKASVQEFVMSSNGVKPVKQQTLFGQPNQFVLPASHNMSVNQIIQSKSSNQFFQEEDFRQGGGQSMSSMLKGNQIQMMPQQILSSHNISQISSKGVSMPTSFSNPQSSIGFEGRRKSQQQ